MSFKGVSFAIYILGHSYLISGESFPKKNQVTKDLPLPFFNILKVLIGHPISPYPARRDRILK